jgi:hypothetical protein
MEKNAKTLLPYCTKNQNFIFRFVVGLIPLKGTFSFT